MDESMFNAASELEPQIYRFPTLPPELMLIIFWLLSHEDQQTFSLLSQSCRQLALPALFRKLVYSRNVMYCIKELKRARAHIKAAIKDLVLKDVSYKFWDFETILFPFLKTLPNLQSFRWHHAIAARKQPFLQLVASLQHCPLEHLTYWAPREVPEEPVTGPPRLKTLSVKFHHAHVYELIRPSFSTLVELEIYPGSVTFDLLPLRPLGRTLRKFVYKVDGFDPDILDTIPDVFPHLTALKLVVWNATQDYQWRIHYDAALATNTKLQHLSLFGFDFIFCADSGWLHANCWECADERRQATRALAMACTKLKCCSWNNSHAQYFFNVRSSSEGNTPPQVEMALEPDGYSPEPFTDCRR